MGWGRAELGLCIESRRGCAGWAQRAEGRVWPCAAHVSVSGNLCVCAHGHSVGESTGRPYDGGLTLPQRLWGRTPQRLWGAWTLPQRLWGPGRGLNDFGVGAWTLPQQLWWGAWTRLPTMVWALGVQRQRSHCHDGSAQPTACRDREPRRPRLHSLGEASLTFSLEIMLASASSPHCSGAQAFCKASIFAQNLKHVLVLDVLEDYHLESRQRAHLYDRSQPQAGKQHVGLVLSHPVC